MMNPQVTLTDAAGVATAALSAWNNGDVGATITFSNTPKRIKADFSGTVDGASIHPREVVRAALSVNACAAIFAHNHPSGISEPSAADRAITNELRDALRLIGVRILDHIVVGAECVSMAGRGLM